MVFIAMINIQKSIKSFHYFIQTKLTMIFNFEFKYVLYVKLVS